ncbi:MAG TPA: nucleoside-diphosphate sugar epimerase/dehydratase [Blastocatellia bacterium]|nr:nucleoside-diphosphate sugar epimerase/dehydratase [Blastocatellia bacterium]
MQSQFLKYRTILIVISQAILLVLAYLCSFLLRFDFRLQGVAEYSRVISQTLPLLLVLKLAVFYYFGLFSGWWKYAGMSDLLDIIKAALVSSPLLYLAVYFIWGVTGYPRSTFLIDMLLTVVFIGGARFLVRAYSEQARSSAIGVNTLVVGAGRAGNMIVRELKTNPGLGYNPIGFVDDNPTKKGVSMQGIKVLGTTANLPALIEKYAVARILIATPSARGEDVRRIIDRCYESKVEFQILPPMAKLINGLVSVDQVRTVNIEDLLARDPVRLNLTEIGAKLQGRTILVTGAGGSIGSELVRQVARFGPAKLILFERSETDLHKMDLELAANFPQLNYLPVIGDILDTLRLQEVFTEQRPQVIFHAAAYKHVPMMEKNCFQAVRNNVIGTYNLAMMADRFGVEDFVMISSDKAVRPTNIMGVTKRIAELIILGLQNHSTKFVSVRFGNVLGSNGSVLPLFKEQIEKRKPVTVTHPQAIRYFMTIPEASQLVLQASTMGRGGEIFVLDMGRPVKILDLAKNLIRLSGLEPDRDIPIVFTGLRPGEKLYEELMLDGEGMKPTPHSKIRVLDGGKTSFMQVQIWVDELVELIAQKDVAGLVAKLQEIVPEYKPSQEILEQAEQTGAFTLTSIQMPATLAAAPAQPK